MTEQVLTEHQLRNALEVVKKQFPHHVSLLDQHRGQIISGIVEGRHDIPALGSIPMPLNPVIVAAEITGPSLSDCALAVAKVMVDQVNLLLNCLGVSGIDPLEGIKNWLKKLAKPVLDFIKTTISEIKAGLSALSTAKKVAAVIGAFVSAGGLAAIWESIKHWSWSRWAIFVVKTTATITAWIASDGVLLVAKLVKVFAGVADLITDTGTMVNVCDIHITFPPPEPSRLWSKDDFGVGAEFVSLQIGDFNGDTKDEIIGFWNNGGNMAAIVYGWNGKDVVELCRNENLGVGHGFTSMKIGDINGDGKDEIIQFRNNDGRMGAIVYGWDDHKFVEYYRNDNLSRHTEIKSMQIGDINGDGKDELIQFWNNNGDMAAIVYEWDYSKLSLCSRNDDLGSKVEVMDIQTGNINGDGKEIIMHAWNNSENHNTYEVFLYGWDGINLKKVNPDSQPLGLNRGIEILGRQIGDINGDGKDEIIQFYKSSGEGDMGVRIMASDRNKLSENYANERVGKSTGNVSMQTTSLINDKLKPESGHHEIIAQMCDHDNHMHLNYYAWDAYSNELKVIASGNTLLNIGHTALLTGNVTGDYKAEVLQFHEINGKLGLFIFDAEKPD